VTIRWSARARRHLESIYEYIAADSPNNAARMVERIQTSLRQIEMFPDSGRIVPELGLPHRELIEAP
jgi:plasmid stabilization system protein ParE